MKRGAVLREGQGPSLAGLESLARVATLLALLLLIPALVMGFSVPMERDAAAWLLAGTSGALAVLMAIAFVIWWRHPRLGARAAWITLGGALLLVAAAGVAHPLALPGAAG
jgi:hypothetical protein